ncbi:DUF2927 domain-containing protein [Mameliella sediminis]|uniref:DUF2927 domain-containing protein n=1 Tax=Mameliella sediminis TaxID=2836866 RepID=UPI001C475A51|nr:DUF2927 domain-containing protein [Mameliella sediminis]MBY6113597.1 DUF2927 domain-containing protein [Antarctobacter heliothermus]MBY6143055.1 DUF2927 domain-containing protein [Mameliella alba]MBV7394895.1 DUF2927 domain-containing protein [Mameliella sediminis]MBY6159910.1 DUF2927 domain-containing protein [Mameliella alba]MBY6168381.1 DUF2927 domain-containing protein [Mameliella alba]
MKGGLKIASALGAALILSGCLGSQLAPRKTSVTPAARPAALAPPEKPAAVEPSRASIALANYYNRVQSDLLARGLLRTDGGGPDTAFTDTMLVRNFAAVALEEEYERGAGLRPSSGAPSAIKKWTVPVRMTTEFGPGVPQDQIADSKAEVASYAARLSRITGHPISMVDKGANYHVLFMSEDDSARIAPRIRQIVPDVNPNALRIFDNLPRSIHCVVVAFSRSRGGYDYGTAIAVIRSEHPPLLRRSCIHEELAQGMGLTNDSPRARPSIFNDDDEFALLTGHDELLLKILYDQRLKPGMTAEEALPIVRSRAAELMGSGGPS